MFGSILLAALPLCVSTQVAPSNEYATSSILANYPLSGIGTCCRPGAKDNDVIAATVFDYLKLGGRLIDTAENYENHVGVGMGIKRWMNYRPAKNKRGDIKVVTKVWPTNFGIQKTLNFVKKSLADLQLDFMDAVLLHHPGPVDNHETKPDCVQNEGRSAGDYKECWVETFAALSIAVESKLLRHVGVSNFDISQLQWLMVQLAHTKDINMAPVSIHQIEMHPLFPNWKMREFCVSNGIQLAAWGQFGGYDNDGAKILPNLKIVKTIARKHMHVYRDVDGVWITAQVTPTQVLLRWLTQRGVMVIPGTGKLAHMETNLHAESFNLDKSDMDALDALSQQFGQHNGWDVRDNAPGIHQHMES